MICYNVDKLFRRVLFTCSKQNSYKNLGICYNALNNKSETNNAFGDAHFYRSVSHNGKEKSDLLLLLIIISLRLRLSVPDSSLLVFSVPNGSVLMLLFSCSIPSCNNIAGFVLSDPTSLMKTLI